MARHVKKGDSVIVLTGRYKGRKAKVLEVLAEQQRVRLDVVVIKRHLPRSRNPQHPEGGIVEMFGTVHWSNVAVTDPASGKPTRVRNEVRDGKKVRVAVRSGEAIASAA
jgi:large subunit ribosomal protein L24